MECCDFFIRHMFNKMREYHFEPDSDFYINVIKECCSLKDCEVDCEALEMYNKMRESRIEPDSFIYINAIKACCILKDCEVGKLIHNHTIESGYDLNVFVSNALIDMYCKCKDTKNARRF